MRTGSQHLPFSIQLITQHPPRLLSLRLLRYQSLPFQRQHQQLISTSTTGHAVVAGLEMASVPIRPSAVQNMDTAVAPMNTAAKIVPQSRPVAVGSVATVFVRNIPIQCAAHNTDTVELARTTAMVPPKHLRHHRHPPLLPHLSFRRVHRTVMRILA